MECWVEWSLPNIPLFQHSNCLWGSPLFQYSIIPIFRLTMGGEMIPKKILIIDDEENF